MGARQRVLLIDATWYGPNEHLTASTEITGAASVEAAKAIAVEWVLLVAKTWGVPSIAIKTTFAYTDVEKTVIDVGDLVVAPMGVR